CSSPISPTAGARKSTMRAPPTSPGPVRAAATKKAATGCRPRRPSASTAVSSARPKATSSSAASPPREPFQPAPWPAEDRAAGDSLPRISELVFEQRRDVLSRRSRQDALETRAPVARDELGDYVG